MTDRQRWLLDLPTDEAKTLHETIFRYAALDRVQICNDLGELKGWAFDVRSEQVPADVQGSHLKQRLVCDVEFCEGITYNCDEGEAWWMDNLKLLRCLE